MGALNNALKVYMKRPDRIKSVVEYYLGERLPPDWKCEETGGFLTVRNSKGKLSFRERDFLGKAQAWGIRFLLGLENQDSINLTYPWRLMEMDCLTYGEEIWEEEADMCKALEDIKKEAVRQGERQGALGVLFSLVNDRVLKPEEAARRAKLSKAAFCRKMRKAGYPKELSVDN